LVCVDANGVEEEAVADSGFRRGSAQAHPLPGTPGEVCF
jgi:hypothetical protein